MCVCSVQQVKTIPLCLLNGPAKNGFGLSSGLLWGSGPDRPFDYGPGHGPCYPLLSDCPLFLPLWSGQFCNSTVKIF